MQVTIRQLVVFEAVARNLSFTKASAELHLTQPAVSMQIKQVEDSIELALFEQLGKKIYLTEAGREMYRYARSIQQQLAEAELVFEDLKGIKRGQLTIAVASTANYFAPKILAAFRSRHPNVTFSLDVTNRKGLLTHLDNNDTDLVIMGKPPQSLGLESQQFMDNPLVAIAPMDHSLVNHKHISINTILKETFILREEGSGTRSAIERFFTDHGTKISTTLNMSSNEAIKQAVQAGLGLGIVSIHTLEMELELNRLAILDVVSFPILRHWYIVHRSGKRLTPMASAFTQFTVENAEQLMEPG